MCFTPVVWLQCDELEADLWRLDRQNPDVYKQVRRSLEGDFKILRQCRSPSDENDSRQNAPREECITPGRTAALLEAAIPSQGALSPVNESSESQSLDDSHLQQADSDVCLSPVPSRSTVAPAADTVSATHGRESSDVHLLSSSESHPSQLGDSSK